MINALVVDDEKLVRKGFLSMTDWSSYDIRIVGEAKDGHSALAMLGKNDVDLLFVDISMPGMTGFELIEEVRVRYPQIKSVVLTCHHEFDYVQEALRLGAIDYIVKTLLNRGNVDETMKRIMKRLSWETREAAAPAPRAFPGAIAYLARSRRADAGALLNALPAGRKSAKLTDAIWLQPVAEGGDGENPARELPAAAAAHWQAVRLAPAAKLTQSEAETLIAERLPSYLYYDAAPDIPEAVQPEELADSAAGLREAAAGDALADIGAELEQLRWPFFGKEWKRLVERIETARPDPCKLLAIAEDLTGDWLLALEWEQESETTSSWRPEQPPRGWKQTKAWLAGLSATLQRRMVDVGLSREVVVCLLRAIAYMKRHAASDLNQNAVAKQVGMSRSYFSQCFKKYTGASFGDTLRAMKIEQAKALLGETELSVYEIASRIGFEDDKHFSRLFRERAGVYPTEYRLQVRTEGMGG